jgi:hypothetical protein
MAAVGTHLGSWARVPAHRERRGLPWAAKDESRTKEGQKALWMRYGLV